MCINFLQITQKVLTKEMVHFLELTTEILSFLETFSVRKTTSQLFLYLESLTQRISTKKKLYFWHILDLSKQIKDNSYGYLLALFFHVSSNCF